MPDVQVNETEDFREELLLCGEEVARALGLDIRVEWSFDNYNVPEEYPPDMSSRRGIYDFSRDIICMPRRLDRYPFETAKFFLCHEVIHVYEARFLARDAFFPNIVVRVGRTWRVVGVIRDGDNIRILFADDIIDYMWNFVSDYTVNRTLKERFSMKIPRIYLKKTNKPKFKASIPGLFDYYRHGEPCAKKKRLHRLIRSYPGSWKVLNEYLAPLKVDSPKKQKIKAMKALFRHFANGTISVGTCTIKDIEKAVGHPLPDFWQKNRKYTVFIIGL